MATVWNSADETTNITLSNTNHTATSTAGGNNGVRSKGVQHTNGVAGKFYLEFTNILSPGGGGAYGVQFLADALGGAAQIYVDPAGNLHFLASSVSMGAIPDGKTLAFAFDFTNKKVWARYDAGSWVGDGTAGADPATNVHGADITALAATALYPVTWLQNNPGHCTLNCGDSAFVQTMPSGFVAWDSTPPFSPSQTAVLS